MARSKPRGMRSPDGFIHAHQDGNTPVERGETTVPSGSGCPEKAAHGWGGAASWIDFVWQLGIPGRLQALHVNSRLLKNVMSAGKTRQNPTKKRSLCTINEHFEEDFNAVLPSAIVFQQPVSGRYLSCLCCPLDRAG
jgi:hypothetical protein